MCCACRTPRRRRWSFADRSMEAVAYYAYWASTELAEERGPYSTFEGSLWHRGHPAAGHARAAARGARRLRRGRSVVGDWTGTRCASASSGSACATPTAWRSRRRPPSPTSSACRRRIEPTYQNLYVKSNLSGEFTVVNEIPGGRPEEAGHVGRGHDRRPQVFRRQPGKIDRIPPDVRRLYATAFEIDPAWLVEAARGGRNGSTRRNR